MGDTKYLQISDEATWLAKRKGYVTSTEVAALYGLSPWQTAFELYHQKRGNVDGGLEDNRFLKFGRYVEKAVVQMIQDEKPEWKISPMRLFAYDDEDKIGSSFDYLVEINGKTGLLEIKSTSYKEFKEKFVEHHDGSLEAPTQYEVQVQTQLEVARNYDFVLLAVFIADTRDLRFIIRKRDAEMGQEIRKAVRDFWTKGEPDPDYMRDKAVLIQLAPTGDPNKIMDATTNNEITELAAQYRASKDIIANEEKNASAAAARLIHLFGDTKFGYTNHHKITMVDVKPSEGTLITQDMVGTYHGGRKGTKYPLVKDLKGA